MSWAAVGVGVGVGAEVEQGVWGHLQMGHQIMKLLGEWGAPGLAKLQKNDKRPKAESATPPFPQCFYPTAPSLCSRFRLSRDGERCRKSFAPGEVKQGGEGGVLGGASSVSGAPCRLLFPKVFLFSFARPAATPAARGETRAGILRHCQRHFVCFIIFYYHQVFVPSLSSLVFLLFLLFVYFAPS